MFKRNLSKILFKFANKFKSKEPDIAIIIYTINVCLGSDKVLKGDSLKRLSEFAQSISRENSIKLDNKVKEKS